MRTRRAVLGAALAATGGLLPTTATIAAGPPLAARPLSRADLPWWRDRHAAKLEESRRRRPIDLVFLGDSITQNYERSGPPAFLDYHPVWNRFYGDRRALNLGFTGDATSHLLWRIENGEVAGIAPRVAVILIGANNFGRLHWSAADTVEGIGAVVDAARARLPMTRIVLLTVLPSDRGPWVTASTARTNAALRERYGRADGERVHLVDMTAVFERDGRIDLDLYADPRLPRPRPALHPDATGQAMMAAALELTIARLMGDRDHRS
jgi:lysophospholipase L1-like esterase